MVDETQDVWVCATCGVEYPPGPEPDRCPICEDERQYVPAGGQRWTTLAQLARDGASVEIAEVEPDLWSLHAAGVGIAQTGMLVRTPAGNLLFDVPGFIDDAAVARVRELGGIAHIVARSDRRPLRREHDGPLAGGCAGAWRALRRRRDLPQARRHGHLHAQLPEHDPAVRRSRPPAGRARFPLRLRHALQQFRVLGRPGAADNVRRSAERYAAWVSGENDHLT